MKFSKLYILSILLLASSCWQEPDHKGYTETDSGLYYKLITIGDGKRKPSIGEYLELIITYRTEKDSVFMDTNTGNDIGMVILPFNHSSFPGSFEEGLTNMNEGDSLSFLVQAQPLFEKFFHLPLPMFLKEGSLVKMDVKLHRILDREQYAAELRRYENMVEDRDIEEQRKLQLYLDTNDVQFTPLDNGMFYLPLKQGSGDIVEKGCQLCINYKGYFLNGKQFESTYERGSPLEFTFGEQGQVISGLETAISLMKEGAKAKFIIPSQLAYGESGSSTGIIPPYTTVVYEIELINLTK